LPVAQVGRVVSKQKDVLTGKVDQRAMCNAL